MTAEFLSVLYITAGMAILALLVNFLVWREVELKPRLERQKVLSSEQYRRAAAHSEIHTFKSLSLFTTHKDK